MRATHAYDYLTKARARLFDWIRPLSQEQFVREFPYGFKTIHATLLHTASAEWIYGRRLHLELVPASQSPFTVEKIKGFAEVETAWADLARDTRQRLEAVTDWEGAVEYRMTPPNAPAVQIRTTRGGVATQLLFHEVHHRSQVMSMLRQLGVAAQNLDYSALMFDRETVPA